MEILQSVEISRSFIKSDKVAVFDEGISIVTEGLATGDQIILTALDFPVEDMEVEIQGVNAENSQTDAAEREAD